MLFSSFTIGENDSAPEVLAILLNGLTILPSRILAIWFMRYAAIWLMALSPITAFGVIYQEIYSRKSSGRPLDSGGRHGMGTGRYSRGDWDTFLSMPGRSN